eukprot:1160586-Pelagomonas_calceolata.AAC.5
MRSRAEHRSEGLHKMQNPTTPEEGGGCSTFVVKVCRHKICNSPLTSHPPSPFPVLSGAHTHMDICTHSLSPYLILEKGLGRWQSAQ